MLTVKTKVKSSKIHELGLFADQIIPKGTTTWKFDPKFDIAFNSNEVEKMPEIQQGLIDKYSFLSKVSGRYIYSIDNTRFVNHSVKNNIDFITNSNEPEFYSIANKDIQIGEELLINYKHLDAYDEKSNENYLNN